MLLTIPLWPRDISANTTATRLKIESFVGGSPTEATKAGLYAKEAAVLAKTILYLVWCDTL